MSTRTDKADLLWDVIERLASRGLFPHKHCLTVRQCANGAWVATIITTYKQMEIISYGESLRSAIEQLRAKIESHPKFCKLADAIGK